MPNILLVCSMGIVKSHILALRKNSFYYFVRMTEKFTFSKHAKERMSSRGISDTMIGNAINNPDKIIFDAECKRIYHKILIEDQPKILLRVFVNTCKKPALVITAYKTSKIDKYEY